MDPEVRNARVRLALAAGAVLIVVATTATLIAVFSRHHSQASRRTSVAPSTTAPTSTTAVNDVAGSNRNDVNLDAVYRMPTTGDPVDFGTAYARALLTYDTTRQTFGARRAALLAWTPRSGWFNDAEPMLDDFLGGKDTWDAAVQVHQSEAVVIQRAWVPDSVKERMRTDRAGFVRTHWPYVVTVSLVREVRGDVGSNTDLPLTLSVIVSCPPKHNCVALAPGRSAVEN